MSPMVPYLSKIAPRPQWDMAQDSYRENVLV